MAGGSGDRDDAHRGVCIVDEVAAGQTKTICWGQNSSGQLGNGGGSGIGNFATPFEVTELANQNVLVPGVFNLCGYKTDPTAGLFCLGSNSGQLGNGSKDNNDHTAASRVGDLVDIASATVGGVHACAIARKPGEPGRRKLYCWGKNSEGQVTGKPADPNAQVTNPIEVKL